MSLEVGTNSWVTINESDSYLADKYGADEWSTLLDAVKEQLLITAFWHIYSSDYSIEKSSTNENVKNAQIETAWYFYEYHSDIWKRIMLQRTGVIEHQISKFREQYVKGTPLPFIVEAMLKDFYSPFGIATFSREID